MTKRIRVRAGVTCVPILLALLVTSTPAAAKPKPITGKLSKPGYTVIALTANGKARAVRAHPRKFTVRPPAKVVTLQLRARNGIYAGPVVIVQKKKGKRAILGVKAGAKLGRVKVKARKGYARLKRKLPKKLLDPKRWARAKRGVPIGAGRFGRVRSRHAHGGAPGDRDLDGIPDPLDIDDDGDLVLDNLDSSTKARASQKELQFNIGSGIGSGLQNTVNANATALTNKEIDAALSSTGVLLLQFLPGDVAELDCGDPDTGLIYCRRNGSTGKVSQLDVPPSASPPFPACCDPDGDGFGTLQQVPNAPGQLMNLLHGAATTQIGTGDLLIERVTTDGIESQFPAAVPYVFATVPALVSYSDGQGNSETVSYPVAPGPQTTDGLPVAAGPNGDVVVRLTFWRPQRRPISGETCPPPTGRLCSLEDWIDIGHLVYSAQPAVGQFFPGCPPSTFSEDDPNTAAVVEDDPNLTPAPPPQPNTGGFTDLAPDQPANPANTFSYTLNLTQCLASQGVSFNSGETQGFTFPAITTGGVASQALRFKRQ